MKVLEFFGKIYWKIYYYRICIIIEIYYIVIRRATFFPGLSSHIRSKIKFIQRANLAGQQFWQLWLHISTKYFSFISHFHSLSRSYSRRRSSFSFSLLLYRQSCTSTEYSIFEYLLILLYSAGLSRRLHLEPNVWANRLALLEIKELNY